ncbi:MAG: hypothetical protein AAGD14_07875 [Planctomycetota bacterium]
MEKALHEIPEDRIHDPREENEFFQGLPAHVQEEMREAWRREEGQGSERAERRNYTYKVFVFEMVACFVFIHIFGIFRSPVIFVWAAACGAITGVVAARARAGSISYPIIATGCLILSGNMNFFAWLGMAGTASLMGHMHRLRSFEGTEA